jgi:hypothetical protein
LKTFPSGVDVILREANRRTNTGERLPARHPEISNVNRGILHYFPFGGRNGVVKKSKARPDVCRTVLGYNPNFLSRLFFIRNFSRSKTSPFRAMIRRARGLASFMRGVPWAGAWIET